MFLASSQMRPTLTMLAPLVRLTVGWPCHTEASRPFQITRLRGIGP